MRSAKAPIRAGLGLAAAMGAALAVALAVAVALGTAFAPQAASVPGWTTSSAGAAPFAQPLAQPDNAAADRFLLGRSFFSIPWVAAPSATTARDGLGPLFNANTCASCHQANGSAATIDAAGQPLRPLLFKLAQPALHDRRLQIVSPDMPGHGRVVDPHYGGQIALNATGRVAPEARPRLKMVPQEVRYPDGATLRLEQPIPRLEDMAYGPLADETVIFLRQPPALAGLGLIEAVPAAEILAWEDPEDRDGDGISARANRLPDGRLGRYGWKASEPTLLHQTANAAAADMGLTNSHYPQELCAAGQSACQNAPRGRPSPEGMTDLPDLRLAAIASYLAGFRAPQPERLSPKAEAGAGLFVASGCTACHRPELSTADGRRLRPMSDYLLHDMGPALADGVREHLAEPAEFRTAPLWGLGARLRAGHRFLHDARARTPEEAILWHGGEATAAREAFFTLSPAERAAIVTYLEQL